MTATSNKPDLAIQKPRMRKRANSDPFRDSNDRPLCGESWRQFVYLPLDRKTKEIRLLLLFPSCDFDSDPVGALLNTDVQRFNYEAVSYVWGDQSDQLYIQLGGFKAQIGRNAHTALRFLRHVKRFRLLWLDALCINQLDLDERNHQVTLMRNVFSKAWGVIFWLGEPVKSNADFLKGLLMTAMTSEQIERKGVDAAHTQPAYRQSWETLLNFFNQDFWRRLWIVPELKLGHENSNSFFQAGILQVSCDEFWQAMKHSWSHQTPISGIEFSLNLPLNFSVFENIPFIKARQDLSREALFFALNANTDCTNPRDRIYALLGFTPELRIEPRYEKSVESVYQDAAYAIFTEQHSLELLLASGCDPRGPRTLPSWVPDWRAGSRVYDEYQLWTPYKSWYNSNGGQPAVIKWRDQSLRVAARRIIGPFPGGLLGPHAVEKGPYNPLNLVSELFRGLYSVWHFCRNSWDHGFLPKYTSFGLLEEHLQRTLYLDRYYASHVGSNTHHAKQPHEVVLEKIFQLADTEAKVETACASFISWLTAERIDINVIVTAKVRLENARIAVSPSGQLCLLPAWMEGGDCIYILAGCPVPIALRPVDNTEGRAYQVLGGAYVHGMMDGEAVYDSPKRVSTGDPDAYDAAFQGEIWLV